MWHLDLYVVERMAALRIEEEHRQAEARRLQKQARMAHQGWLFRQRCWILSQLGRLFVSLGERMLQADLTQPLALDRHARGST